MPSGELMSRHGAEPEPSPTALELAADNDPRRGDAITANQSGRAASASSSLITLSLVMSCAALPVDGCELTSTSFTGALWRAAGQLLHNIAGALRLRVEIEDEAPARCT